MSHTKGPWKWTAALTRTPEWELHQEEFEVGEEDSICYHGADWPMKAADMNLMATAPDLLAACKKLIMHHNQGDIHPIDFQRIEQAIAKAEGSFK